MPLNAWWMALPKLADLAMRHARQLLGEQGVSYPGGVRALHMARAVMEARTAKD